MAAAVITYRTILDEIKLLFNIATDQWMSDAEINGFILQYFTGSQNTFKFQVRSTQTSNYVRTWMTNGARAYFFAGSFTGEDDCVYVYYPNGTIHCTTGAPTATEIEVTATRINFVECACAIGEYLLLQRSKEAPKGIGGVSYTPPDEDRIRSVMEGLRGVRTF